MAYAVMRAEKYKSKAAVSGAIRHDTRERMPLNADPERSTDNAYTANYEQAMQRYKELLPEKRRSDAVHAVEFVFSASPEWFEKATKDQVKEFANRARVWGCELFGKENELITALHADEKTVHLHSVFIPLKDGKLNAKAFIGGKKYRMKDLQDDFFEKVGKPLGMDRGVHRENVRHTDVSEYAKVMKAEKAEIAKLKKELNVQLASVAADRADFEQVKKDFNQELYKGMNSNIQEFFGKRGIHPEDTVAFWASVTKTLDEYKKRTTERKANTEPQTEVKKARGRV